MATPAASGACTQCGRLRADYQRATAIRMQAEADYLTAVHSQNSSAIQGARRTVQIALAEWTRADQTLRRHEKLHEPPDRGRMPGV